MYLGGGVSALVVSVVVLMMVLAEAYVGVETLVGEPICLERLHPDYSPILLVPFPPALRLDTRSLAFDW